MEENSEIVLQLPPVVCEGPHGTKHEEASLEVQQVDNECCRRGGQKDNKI